MRHFTDFFWTCRNHLMIWRTLRLKMEDSSMWAQGRDGQEKKQRNKSKVEHRQQSSWLLLYEYFLLLSLGELCNRFYSLVCNMLFIGFITIMIYRKSLPLCFIYLRLIVEKDDCRNLQSTFFSSRIILPYLIFFQRVWYLPKSEFNVVLILTLNLI